MVDPSGGVNDSMTMAIGHRDGHVAILDRLLEIRPPFNPDDAVRECADLCRAYGVTRVVSDKYAAAWPVARFSEAGIALEQSAKPKSDLYLNFLSLANSGRSSRGCSGALRVRAVIAWIMRVTLTMTFVMLLRACL
jgi:hypothetical protein